MRINIYKAHTFFFFSPAGSFTSQVDGSRSAIWSNIHPPEWCVSIMCFVIQSRRNAVKTLEFMLRLSAAGHLAFCFGKSLPWEALRTLASLWKNCLSCWRKVTAWTNPPHALMSCKEIMISSGIFSWNVSNKFKKLERICFLLGLPEYGFVEIFFKNNHIYWSSHSRFK